METPETETANEPGQSNIAFLLKEYEECWAQARHSAMVGMGPTCRVCSVLCVTRLCLFLHHQILRAQAPREVREC